jgi:protein-S-isoprenylcysteine O-methyltransferase Ste14
VAINLIKEERKMTDQKEPERSKPDTRKNIIRRLMQVSMTVILSALILFLSAGQIKWIYAWIYILTSVLVIVTNAFIFRPELISERGRKKENVEKWDKIITGIILIPWVTFYFIAGLDIRFGWSPVLADWIHIAALIIFILGNALVSWAMMANTYFSTSVRIQNDRGHTVTSGGPYSYIRHPGYLGMIIYLLSTPIILGSVWALIPTFITITLFIIRTSFEDDTLKNKLEGYKEYAERVKYRLFAGIW